MQRIKICWYLNSEYFRSEQNIEVSGCFKVYVSELMEPNLDDGIVSNVVPVNFYIQTAVIKKDIKSLKER